MAKESVNILESVRVYYVQLYANAFENLDKRGTIVDKNTNYKKKRSRPIIINEIEKAVDLLQLLKCPG